MCERVCMCGMCLGVWKFVCFSIYFYICECDDIITDFAALVSPWWKYHWRNWVMQTSSQTGRQGRHMTDWHAGTQTGKHTASQSGKHACRLKDQWSLLDLSQALPNDSFRRLIYFFYPTTKQSLHTNLANCGSDDDKYIYRHDLMSQHIFFKSMNIGANSSVSVSQFRYWLWWDVSTHFT